MISAESKIKIIETPIKGKAYVPVGSMIEIEVTQIELSYEKTNLLKRILTAVKS